MPGERYEKVVGVWDSTFSEFKICPRCRDIRTWMINQFECFCWAYGTLHEDIREHFGEMPRIVGESDGLAFAMGRKLVELRRHNEESRRASL